MLKAIQPWGMEGAATWHCASVSELQDGPCRIQVLMMVKGHVCCVVDREK